MNKLILGAMAMIGMAMASTAAPVEVARGRVAVVYFSWSPGGNTRFAAETIASKAGARLFEIKAEKPADELAFFINCELYGLMLA